MLRNFRRFFASVLLVLVSLFVANAQTTGDVMRERITKAKGFIAVKNYNAAIYELENIKRETNDPTINSVVNVLLMNSYLEQGDYKRAQDFLTELVKSTKPNSAANYTAVAAQVIRGAKMQLERYKSLGLSVSDRNLPLEAATDIEKMRQTLELIVEQSKVLGKDKTQTANAMALLEEATNARGTLAKDDYDASRWKNESADAREMWANARSVVINADGTTESLNQNTTASTTTAATTQNTAQTNPSTTNQSVPTNNTNLSTNNVILNPVQTNPTTNNSTTAQTNPQSNNTVAVKETTNTTERNTADTQKSTDKTEQTPRTRTRLVENNNNSDTNPAQTQTVSQVVENNSSPLDVGSLVDFATQRVNPIYPQQARAIRQTGIVKVEMVIDEEGKVAEIQKMSGPSLLQSAAKDAAKKWRFKPFVRDGQPVKAMGFLSFNFNL